MKNWKRYLVPGLFSVAMLCVWFGAQQYYAYQMPTAMKSIDVAGIPPATIVAIITAIGAAVSGVIAQAKGAPAVAGADAEKQHLAALAAIYISKPDKRKYDLIGQLAATESA